MALGGLSVSAKVSSNLDSVPSDGAVFFPRLLYWILIIALEIGHNTVIVIISYLRCIPFHRSVLDENNFKSALFGGNEESI